MLCFAVKSQVKPRDSIDQLFEFAILLFFSKSLLQSAGTGSIDENVEMFNSTVCRIGSWPGEVAWRATCSEC